MLRCQLLEVTQLFTLLPSVTTSNVGFSWLREEPVWGPEQLSSDPLDLAKSEFKEATKKALSFTTRKALCIIGNAEGGKKLTRCMEATRDLKELPLEFVGSNFLNCRQPQSTGIDHISKFIQAIPIPEFRPLTHVTVLPGSYIPDLQVIHGSSSAAEGVLHPLHAWWTIVIVIYMLCAVLHM